MGDVLQDTIDGLTAFKLALLQQGLSAKRINLALTFLENAMKGRMAGESAIFGKQSFKYIRELVEADELIQIYSYLQANWNRVEPELWSRIMEQPSDPYEETSNTPRSFQYELWLTSWFHRAGIAAEWVGKNVEPDCRFQFGGKNFVVEAKRPLSVSSVGNAIDRARKQLRDRLSREPDRLGLVAISLNLPILETLRSEAEQRGEEVLPEGDRIALMKYGIEFVADLIPSLTESLNRMLPIERALGVIFTACYPAIEIRPECTSNRTALGIMGTMLETTTDPFYQNLTSQILSAIEMSDKSAMMPNWFREGTVKRLKEAVQSCSSDDDQR